MPQVRESREGRADVRDANATPGRYVGDGRRTERAEMPADDELVCRLGLRPLPQPRGWRNVPGELPVLEMGARRLPHQAAGRDRRPGEPAAEPFVPGGAGRKVGVAELLDVAAGPRSSRGKSHDLFMQHLKVSECWAAGRAPRAEAALHRRERIGRVLPGRHKMQRRAHQRRLHDLAAIDRPGQLRALEACKTRPERDVWRRRPLALKAAETLDRIDDADLMALQQELPRPAASSLGRPIVSERSSYAWIG